MSATAAQADVGPDGIPLAIYRKRWWTLAVLNLSLVLVVMGNSSVNVALPTWEKELGATLTQLQWIVDGYALAFGGLLLTMGALGDRFGRRGALQAGLAIFGLASAWAALFASEPWHLITARTVMGIGAALVMPATLSILTTVFPRDERGKAIGIWAAFAGIGGVIGLLASGALLEGFEWPSIFWLNVVVVGLAIGAGLFLVPTSKDSHQSPLDLVGSVLSILGIGGLLYAIIEGPVEGWTSALVLTGFIVGSLALVLFVLWEQRSTHPMLPMSFFRERGFNAGVIVISLVFFAMFAMFFLLTQYLQGVRGFSPLEAAVRFIPLTIGMIMAAPNSDRLVRKFSARAVVTTGLVIVSLGLLGFATLDMDTPFWMFGGIELLLGLGMGLAMAPATTVIMESIPRDKAGVGSSMNDTAREVGGAFGIAILGSILKGVYEANLSDKLPQGIPEGAREGILSGIGGAARVAQEIGGPAAGAIIAEAQQAFVDALLPAFATAGILVAIAAGIVVFFFPRDRDIGSQTDSDAGDDVVQARIPGPSPLSFENPTGWLIAHRGDPSAPAWRHDLRGAELLHIGGPAQTKDAIYVAIHNDAGYHAIALRRKDGTEMWRKPLPSEPVATPRVVSDRIAWELHDGDGTHPRRISFGLDDGRMRSRVVVRGAAQ